MFPMTLFNSTCTPCRKIIRKGHQNFAHFFPSIKNGISVGCESHLEAECCYLLEYDRDITRYQAQPHSFEWADAGKTISTRRTFWCAALTVPSTCSRSNLTLGTSKTDTGKNYTPFPC